MTESKSDPDETDMLLQRFRRGDRQALEQLLARHRDWLRQIVLVRLDGRLRGRIDPSDVVQEVQLEVSRRIHDYLSRAQMPFRLWLRQTAYENLILLRRKHLGAECRNVEREVALPEDSSLRLGRQLIGKGRAPDEGLVAQELVERVRRAMSLLSDPDREILLLRFFEALDNQEVTRILGLEASAASKRLGRALFRLRKLLLTEEPEQP